MAAQNPPLPTKRTKIFSVVDNVWKSKLIESFEGFNASQVSQHHIEMAEACIQNGGSKNERYRLVPFERILIENQQLGVVDYLASMTSAYDLLLKFVINLLKPNRPSVWRSIKTNTPAFLARVACMRGYEDILKTAGYTEKDENSLQFPDSVQEPDKTKLYVIAAELLMARLEVEQMNSATQQQQWQQQEQQGDSLLFQQSSPRQQARAQTAMVHNPPLPSSSSGGTSGQWGQQQQPYNTYGTGMNGQQQQQVRVQQYRATAAATAVQSAGHDIHMRSQSGGDAMARPQDQQQGQWHRSQSDEPMQNGSNRPAVGGRSATEHFGNAQQRPKPKPRIPRSGKSTPEPLSQPSSSQNSLPSPSSSTSSLYSPTSDADESSLQSSVASRKAVAFALTSIPEGTPKGEGGDEAEPEDPYLKELRARRRAITSSLGGNATVAAPSLNLPPAGIGGGGGGGLGHRDIAQRPHTSAHAVRHDSEPKRYDFESLRQPPSHSALRQPLRGSWRAEPTPPPIPPRIDQTTPSRWSDEQATPRKWSDEQNTPGRRSGELTPPIRRSNELTPPTRQRAEDSDDSSSDKYLTPPTSMVHNVIDSQPLLPVTKTTTPPNTTERSSSSASDVSEHESVLDTLRRRRRELQQQRELSGKKQDISPPTTANNAVKTKTENDSLSHSQVPPTTSGSPPFGRVEGVPRPDTRTGDTSGTGTAKSSGIYCPKCYCSIRLGQKYCGYCNHPVYPMNVFPSSTASTDHHAAPLRARPVEDEPVQPVRQDPDAPALPPRPSPRSRAYNETNSLFDSSGRPIKAVAPDDKPRPPMKAYDAQQAGQPFRARVEDTPATQPQRQQYDNFGVPVISSRSTSNYQPPTQVAAYPQPTNYPGGYTPKEGVASSHMTNTPATPTSSSSGGASGVSPSPVKSGLAQYSYKLERYRDFLKQNGKTDAQINSDPEYLKMMEEETRKQQPSSPQGNHGNRVYGNLPGPPRAAVEQRASQAGQSPKSDPMKREEVDVSKFKKVNTLESDKYSFDIVENQEAMEKLKQDGDQLLTWIKMCVPFGYSLDEIQIASDFVREGKRTKSRTPLQFLDSDWAQKTRKVQDWVAGTQSERRPFVGRPTENETRKALVETSGNVEDAVDVIYKNRKNKINTLRQRFDYMRTIQPSIPELLWKTAVDVLSVNDMDVDKACYAVQCDWLKPLYESINSEHKKLKQEEMKEIKIIVSRKDEAFSKEAKCRMLMAECDFVEQSRAQIVLDLMEQVEGDENYPLNYYVDAAHDFENLESASDFLLKECPIGGLCAGEKIPIHEMITMPGCTCSFCKECFKGHFEVVIKEKQVKHFNCPMCKKPDLSNKDDTQEMYELIFVSMIKEYLGKDEYDLCQEKLKEFSLTKDPNFLWCANDKCGSGFIYEGDRTRPRGIQCLGCKNNMCWKCKKPWEAQHDGITCEQFTQWKLDNDPEAQELGLAAHLNENGIECPACHARYELARGGCMHFKCTKCPNEFCSGCGESIKRGKECGKYNSCAGRGLHAHHPRDCLFFLRDFPVKELQNFLEANKMDFDTDAPREQIEAAKREKREKKKKKAKKDDDEEEEDEGMEEGAEEPEEEEEEPKANLAEEVKDEDVELHCRVEEQKEDIDGLKDEVCGKIAEKGHAGLCDLHYKEYLVNIINKNGLDPVTIYELGQIKAMLTREEMGVPEQEDDEEDQQYRDRLIQHVQARLNLTGGRKAGEAQQAQAPPPAAAPVPEPVAVEDIEDAEN